MNALLLQRPGDDYQLTLADVPTPTPELLQHAQGGVAAGGQHVAIAHAATCDHQGIVEAVGPQAGLDVLDLFVTEDPRVVVVDVDVRDLQQHRAGHVLDRQVHLGWRGVANHVAVVHGLCVPLSLVRAAFGGRAAEGGGFSRLECVHDNLRPGATRRTFRVHRSRHFEIGQRLGGGDSDGQPNGLGVLGSGHGVASLFSSLRGCVG
jgi:hypothetical protein